MERNYTVYKHTSPSGKVYIGITGRSVKKRWNNGRGYKTQPFYYAIEKYGWNNIQHEILVEGLTKEQAEQMEIELIAEYKSNKREFGYNIQDGGSNYGKHSEETKRKISRKLSKIKKGVKFSETHRKNMMGENNNKSKKVICGNKLFSCAKDCAEFYGVPSSTMRAWLNGTNYMPQEWYDRGLRYIDKQMSDYTVQEGKARGNKLPQSKKVYCDGIIFDCARECVECYGVKDATLRSWLRGDRPMPQKFKDLGLRYATEEDILNYPTYDKNIK